MPLAIEYAKINLVDSKQIEAELGRRLRDHRKSLGISQSYLADLLNRDQTAISKIEQGNRQVSVSEFLLWCKALNLNAEKVWELIQVGPYER